MSLLISSAAAGATGGRGREALVDASGLHWSWQTSGGLEVLRSDQHPVVIVGTLGGPLRRSALRPDVTVGRLAGDADRSNGWFAVILAVPGGVRIVTDAGGSMPVYFGAGRTCFAVGSRALDVAGVTGLLQVDEASVADFMRNGSVCHPYTWYDGVRVLPPGSVITVTRGGADVRTYWEPVERRDVHDAHGCEREWGAALRAEVQAAVALGIEGRGRARVMYSGGEDSRVVASLLPRDLDAVLTTVLDSRNREYALAQRAAFALRRRFEWVARPADFYLSSFEDRVATVGQGADILYTHLFGGVAARFADADVLLGGYLADTFFKSVYMNNVLRVRFLPERLLPPRPDVLMGLEAAFDESRLKPEIAVRAAERRRAHQQRLLDLRPLTAGRWHDVWPLGPHCIDYVHHEACRAIGPRVVEPFFAQRVYRLAAAMPDVCRLERASFRHAFGPGLGAAGWLSTSKGYRMAAGRRTGAFTARATLIWRHRLDEATGLLGLQGPWSHLVDPLVPEAYLSEEQAGAMHEALGAILADGDSEALLRLPDLPNPVRWRALTLGFTPAMLLARKEPRSS